MNLDSYSDNYYRYYQTIIKDPTIPYPRIEGMIMKEEQEWLFDRASENDSIVEIGSWTGMSTYALCAGCKGTVYAIDTFEGTDDEIDGSMALAKTGKLYEIFLKNVGHFSNLKVIKSKSEDSVLFFEPKSIDMIFIDGDHRYEAVSKDLKFWFPVCKKFLCGHDKNHEGVQRALKEFDLPWKEVPELAMWYINLGELNE
jgi:hypothetical protein